ncbi:MULTISPECIES: hypothetical protein [unclassified Rhodococcus (in: high G+C Gram-positive bacteria)]|uniref:hypothetical protein n=1 Tax=Rhodococcus sp. SJ-3 TaxID=3454628 RepID=UPI003F79A50C
MINRTATRRTAATVLLGAGAALCVGAASPASTATTADPAVAATVTALVADDTVGALAAFPDGFAEVMGYHPSIEPGDTTEGVLTDPDGDCSSPVALPSAFEPACRMHDLGYDLLRYARDIGGELGPQARRDLDTHLQRNLNAACTTETGVEPGCDVMAGIASAAVQINSWRQGYRLPESESPIAYLAVSGAAVLAGSAFLRRSN